MGRSVRALHIGLVSLAVLLPATGIPASADEPVDVRPVGEVRSDSALVYFVRQYNFAGGGRTWYVYSDDTFVGVLDNDCYAFSNLPPGRHLLWLVPNRIASPIELEAGKTYYLDVFLGGIRAVDRTAGEGLVGRAEEYCTPDADQSEDSAEEIRDGYGKAQRRAAGKPVIALPVETASKPDAAAASRRAEQRVARWSQVDLAPYSILFVEDFVVTDPKAADRARESLVQSAPQRLPDLVVEGLGAGVFDEVVRGTPPEARPGAVILRARLTQYKPGSKTARSVLIGLGSAQLEVTAELVDAASGKSLVELPVDRSWAWGGALGSAFGIMDMERAVANDLALYLRRSRGKEPASPTIAQ
jgi:hypothetical protein